jgi:hypothetical protein
LTARELDYFEEFCALATGLDDLEATGDPVLWWCSGLCID